MRTARSLLRATPRLGAVRVAAARRVHNVTTTGTGAFRVDVTRPRLSLSPESNEQSLALLQTALKDEFTLYGKANDLPVAPCTAGLHSIQVAVAYFICVPRIPRSVSAVKLR